MVRLVEQAQKARAPSALADHIAGVFVPVARR